MPTPVHAVHVKARAMMLGLRRGFALLRIQVAPPIADARALALTETPSVIYTIDCQGVQRELCRGKNPRAAWRAALEVLEAAT